MRIVVKVLGTVAVVVLISWPDWRRGILGEVAGQPVAVSALVVAGFFGLVAVYCAALQRTLTLVRAPRPASVWWMFAIPYNFVEDFFIVGKVATALAADGRVPARRWAVVGQCWCALQILSLLPGVAGYAGGAAALPVWAAHWVMTARINRTLAA
jgi:hypothetical protein